MVHKINNSRFQTTRVILDSGDVYKRQIMKGTSLGEGSVIGAGVVLKGEYPANTVIYEKADIVMRPIERKKKDE